MTLDLASLSMTEIVRLQNDLQQELTRRFERRLLMVFSDIVGSTPYFARFGDAMGRQLHQLHIDLVEQSFGPLGGRLVDAVGDGAFCVFPQADAGVRGVMALHEAVGRANASRQRPHQMSLRIGLHWGTVLSDGVQVTGDAVHVGARAARAAQPGGVVLTRAVFQELEPRQRLNCRSIGTQALKGLPEPVGLFELDWRDPDAFPRRVHIEETGQTLELPQQDIVSFGRLVEIDGQPANDIVLHHPDADCARRVSRWQFELRRVTDGLRLRALSDTETLIDGLPVARGAEVWVRSGCRIRVAGTLTLHLTAASRGTLGDDGTRTMVTPGSG